VPPPQASEVLYTTLQRYQLMLLVAGRRLWSRMAPGDFDGSWSRIAPQMTAFTSGAQLAAAQAAVAYVPAVLEEQGIDIAPEARVRPLAFAGVASDGRSLPGLLEGSVVTAKRAMLRGADGGDALALGQRWLEQALQTAIMDAARDATAVEIAARPRVAWVRVVNPPCCSRCAVLATDVQYWNRPLPRHPQCDCFALPTTVANADQHFTNPRQLLDKGLITDLTKAQRQRIDDGTDLTKVLNESRDRWRERMAADRKAASDARKRQTWGANPVSLPPGGVQDFMSHLTSRVEALNALKAAGIAE
jgi:hypothetical protein